MIDPTHGAMVAAAVASGPQAGDAVLSVRQPWAWLIGAGRKTVENRTWTTAHRGLLWIHASGTVDEGDDVESFVSLLAPGPRSRPRDPPTGAIVAAAYLAEVVPEEHRPAWAYQLVTASGPYLWFLSAAAPLKRPIPYRAGTGLLRFKAENVKK